MRAETAARCNASRIVLMRAIFAFAAATALALGEASHAHAQLGLAPYDEGYSDRVYGLAPTPQTAPDGAHCAHVEGCAPCLLIEFQTAQTWSVQCKGRVQLRLAGIDLPQPGAEARCDNERAMGRSALRFLDGLPMSMSVSWAQVSTANC